MTRLTAEAYDQSVAENTAARDALILAALPHVPFDGWTRKTLDRAAAAAGLFGVARLFPGGPRDAVAHFMDMADRRMAEDLKAHDLAALKVRARITLALRLRLERWTPYREAVRRALAFTPRPSFAGPALRGWYKTVDVIWRIAGDRATDFNFYTKRGLLAAVYAATFLYWLDDRSEGCAATWAFLDRRIANAMQIPQIKARVSERLKAMPNPLAIAARLAGFRSNR